MILKGNQRGGAQQLAAHLMNSFDNERVEVAEIRDAVAQDLSGAFAEWSAQASATKCKKNLYSLSLNPDQAQGHLTREQYLELLDRTERSLNLVGQPRAVVFHEKRDKDGVPREHCHAVWSRIDTEKMKAVHIAHDRLKLRTVAREFARDHGLEIPDGLKKDGRRDRFNDRAQRENLGERQQKERSGIPKAEHMANIATCWRQTGNGAAFVQALEAKGYYLARGDRRAYIVVDLHGEVHSVSRLLAGTAKSKELKDRMAGYPLDKLPDVETAQAWAKSKREDYKKAKQHREPSEVEKRTAALREHQQQRRAALDRTQIDLIARHLSERNVLRAMHEAQNTGILTVRLQKQPKGVLAFLTRITGINMIIEKRREKEDKRRASEHARQAQILQDKHERELHEAERRVRALDRLEARENRSADLAALREDFQQMLGQQPERTVKPEFEKAVRETQDRGDTGDDKAPEKEGVSARFNRAAKPVPDLTEEFNREVENRRRREEIDRDLDAGPNRTFDPDDPEN